VTLANPANATLQIAFSDGTHSFFCADQTSCDLDGQVKNLLLLNTTVGDIKITGSFAEAGFGKGADSLSLSSLTITNLGSTAQTLKMAVGDTSFVGPVSAIRASGSGTFNNDVGGSLNLAFFADPANTQPAVNSTDLPGIDLFTTGQTVLTAPDSFSGTKVASFDATGLFSMAEGATLTIQPGASVTGFNEAMATAAVPEPKTWAMLILGFGLMGLMGAKKVRKDRLGMLA
jgi:hypothetical protein